MYQHVDFLKAQLGKYASLYGGLAVIQEQFPEFLVGEVEPSVKGRKI
jgi:hypothetical protein